MTAEMDSTGTDPYGVAPFTEGFQQDPFPAYARLREHAPVHPVPEAGVVMVTTMDLVREVLADPQTYGNAVSAGRRSLPPSEVAHEVAAIRARGLPYRPALGLSDPPVHTRYRRLISRAFTPRSLMWMEPLVEETARELAQALPDGEVVDLIEAVTRPLPVFAIMRILGLSSEHRTAVTRWSDAATAGVGARLTPERWLETEQTMLEFQQVMVAELDDRRAHPRGDLLSVITARSGEEEPLGNGELVWLVRELLVAGNETTTRALAEIVLRLDDRPDPWTVVRENPALLPGLVAEGLRLSTPATGMFRQVRRDTSLGGVSLAAGTTLYLVYGSANRDAAVFPRPEEFDPSRGNATDHLAYGNGIHSCVGQGLAQLEMMATLTALAEAVDGLRVVPDPSRRYLPSFFLRGLVELPVRVERRRGATVRLT